MIYKSILTAKGLKPQPPTEVHHFVLTGTWGSDARIVCWCSKSHYLSKLGWRVMFRQLNDWLAEHERCEPKEQA